MKNKSSSHIRLDLIMLITTFSIQAFALLLTPLYSALAADVVTFNTMFPDVVRGVIDILDIAVMTVGFSLIAVVFFMDIRKKYLYPVIYSGACLFRRLISLLLSYFLNGALDADDILMTVSVFVLDIILLLVVMPVCRGFAARHAKRSALKDKANMLFSNEEAKKDTDSLYPFKKIYRRDNPLQVCLLTIGIILSSVKLISRTVSVVYGYYNGILMTVAGYATDLLTVVIVYALACYLLSLLYGINEKRRTINDLYEK